MLVFVTGATGFVGSAVLPELLGANHTVLALARSDKAAEQLSSQAGVTVLRGDLTDAEILQKGAEQADATIHLAFIHDFIHGKGTYEESCRKDREAIEAIASALKGTNKPFVIVNGTVVTAGQGETDEAHEAITTGQGAVPRSVTENYCVELRSSGVQTTIVRLAPTVHGQGDQGFVHVLTQIAKGKGVSAYIDQGTNKWPAVHRSDAALLFRLVIEKKHDLPRVLAVAELGIPFKSIAEAIGKKYNLPVVFKAQQEAAEHFGPLAKFFGLDNPVDNTKTREAFSWSPQGPTLLEDIRDFY
ncbi:unnamed protein product [Sympodiomycopsis kandeliae]